MPSDIKPIEQEARLSSYDLAKNLDAISKFLMELPLSTLKNVEYQEEAAYDRIDTLIKNINARLISLQESINTSEEAYFKAVEDHYNETWKAVSAINEKLRKLPEIECSQRIPYNIKELLDTATRIGDLSDKQWERMLEIAKLFANPKGE